MRFQIICLLSPNSFFYNPKFVIKLTSKMRLPADFLDNVELIIIENFYQKGVYFLIRNKIKLAKNFS